ncbi:L-aspartate oxidase, partial [Microbacterium aurum]|nr:L-aspartate oxidase [Microbacterium aurum]
AANSRPAATPTRPPCPHMRPCRAATAPADAPAFGRRALQELMWEHVGLVRDAAGLEFAAAVIAGWRARPRTPATEADVEDENLLQVAAALVAAALARTDSVGAHVRRDENPRIRALTPAEGPETAAERTDPWSSITAAAQKESAAC